MHAPEWLEGATCTAVLLAGGRGERVGGDKANLVVGGETLLGRSLATLDRIGLPVVIALRQDQVAPHGRVVVRDVADVAGPLGGLIAALEAVTTEWAFLSAVDMPLLAPEVVPALFRLRGPADVVIPRVAGRDHVLASLVRARVAPRLREASAEGERGVARALERLSPRYLTAVELLCDVELSRVDPALSSFANVNTPEDVASAESALAARRSR